jgi:hypothetical protein
LVHVPFGELGVPFWPQNRGFTRPFRELGDMVSDVKPMVFPSRDIGGEFVRKISVTGLLPKLDAGTSYNGWTFGGGLRLYPEKIAKKIPIGFNSEESFTKVDENSNVADRVWIEMMELKPVEVKKATEEGTGGESQTPFREVVE